MSDSRKPMILRVIEEAKEELAALQPRAFESAERVYTLASAINVLEEQTDQPITDYKELRSLFMKPAHAERRRRRAVAKDGAESGAPSGPNGGGAESKSTS